MTRLTKRRQRYQVDVELPYIELLGSQSPVYNETLAECCGEVIDDPNDNLGSSTADSVSSDWEWMQEYGDISVLENCPGLYEKCININDICCRHDRHIINGPTLAELNERRALSPLINPDMKRLHLVATEKCNERLEQLFDNGFSTRQSRPCLTELNRPIPRRLTPDEHFVSMSPSNSYDKSSSLRKMLLYGINRPGALNSSFYKIDRNSKGTLDHSSESDHVKKVVFIKEENLSADENIESDSESEVGSNVSEKDVSVDGEDEYMSSDDNYDEETPVKRSPGKKRKRSEADDWTPDPKKLLEISKQLEMLNKIINGLRPIAQLSLNAKNRTRREKNKLASRACRLKKKAGHEANKIKLFGLNQENKHLCDVIYDIKSLLTVGAADKRKRVSMESVREQAEKVLTEQVCGRTQDYVDSMLKRFAARGHRKTMIWQTQENEIMFSTWLKARLRSPEADSTLEAYMKSNDQGVQEKEKRKERAKTSSEIEKMQQNEKWNESGNESSEIMQVSSLELCATSVLVRAFTEDSSSTGVNKIVDEISKNRSLDPCLEIILKRIVNTQPANLTDRLLCVLLSGGIHLKSLELRKCTNISLVGLAMALKCQPCIEYLDLSECNQLTHASIADILAKGAPVLKSLIFESCYNMKDPTVQAILRSCNQLTFIGLACSPFLTDDVLFFGSKDAMHPSDVSLSLTGIDMSGCKTVSETTVRQLAVLCGPNLKSVNISWTNIDCIALVYLCGYSLSSAVFLATNAHHEEVPFTVAELEATQQFELQIIQKHTAVDSKRSKKEQLPSDAEPLGIQKVDTSNIVNAESDTWEKERSYEERPTISQETNAECSAPDNAKDYINKDRKRFSVENAPISKEDICPGKCEETDAVFLSQFVDAQHDTSKSNTVMDSCADLDHTSSTARINLESDAIKFDTEDRPLKNIQSSSVNVLEIVQKTNSLELKAENEAIIENNPEISNSPPSNTKHEMNSQCLCEARIGISDTNAPYHTETVTADSVTHSSNVESSNVLALANKLLANEVTSTPLSLKDSQSSNPLTLSVTNESERSAIYVPRQLFNSQITELDISEIKFCDYEVGADCLKMFVSSNRCLRVFKISWKLLDDNLLGLIAQNEPELTDIGLVDCESLSNSGLKMLGEHCKKLSSVDLQGVPFVGDEGLHKILKNGLVSKLTLAECAVTDVTLRNIIKFSSPIITKLDLSWCENLTDHEIANFIRSCPHLEFLDLRQCDASVKTMDALCANGAGIDSLGLCSVQDITDKMTIPLSYTMKNLTFIDIGWNCMLTDETVTAIFKSCGLLVEVSLTGLKRITSQPFLPIISGLAEWRAKREVITTRLRRRGIVTRDLGLQEIYEPDFYIPHRSVHYVPNLQKIDVSFSDKVNDIHLAEIVSVCRGTLRIEDYYSVAIKPRWRI